MKTFQNKYRIPSTRAPWHGYDGGIYFVTVCTNGMEHFFGNIDDVITRRDAINRVSTETNKTEQDRI